jgi:hypothetical protein
MYDVNEATASLIASIDRWPPAQRQQILLQCEAIFAVRDSGEDAQNLIEFLSNGLGIVSKRADGGFDVTLTEKGLAAGAALVKSIAGSRPH